MDYDKTLYNEIGKKIKARRKELKLTQEDLAQLTNYSYSFISNIESRTYQAFSISAFNNIARALNTNMKNLLPDESDLITNNKIKCEYCNFNTEIPYEIIKLLHLIKDLTKKSTNLTCPKCQKKIMY